MWAHCINIALGLWLMIAPAILGYGEAATDNGHIIGPVVVTFSVTALWQSTRGLRKWNYPLAAWLLLAPWILGYDSTMAVISDMGSGVLISIFSSFKGKLTHRFGGGWEMLFGKQ